MAEPGVMRWEPKVENGVVKITWDSSAETDVVRFTVQRNTGAGWTPVKAVKAKAPGTGTSNPYAVKDPSPGKGKIKYRIETTRSASTDITDVKQVNIK